MAENKTVLDRLKGPEERRQVNARVNSQLYSDVEQQIKLDKEAGFKIDMSKLVRIGFENYLDERRNPKSHFNKVTKNIKRKDSENERRFSKSKPAK